MKRVDKIKVVADYMGYELIDGLGYYKKGKPFVAENKMQIVPDPKSFDSFAKAFENIMIDYECIIQSNWYGGKDLKVIYTVDMGEYAGEGQSYPEALFELIVNVIIGENLH